MSTNWILNPAISISEIARRSGINQSVLIKKLNGRPINKDRPAVWCFSDEELERIDQVRKDLISEILFDSE